MNRANRPRLSRISGSSYDSRLMSRAGDGSTLTLDFTTGQLDPRLTFTRAANTATVINSSGLVQTVNADVPRFDHDPTTLAPRGLLIEGAATSLSRSSQDLTNATYWTLQTAYASTSATGGTAPDGTNTGNLFTEPTTNLQRSIYQSYSSAAGTYTFSVWLKAGSGSTRYMRLVVSSGASDFGYVTINMSTGAVQQAATAVGTATNASATVSGNYTATGWRRYSLTVTLAASVNFVFLVPMDFGSIDTPTVNYGRVAYLGDGSTFLVWGAQVESGSGASSYIPTTTSSATRNADECSMTGTNFSDWFTNSAEGSFYAKYSMNNPAAFFGAIVDRYAFEVSNSAGTSRVFTYASYRVSTAGNAGRFPRVFDLGTIDLAPSFVATAAQNTAFAWGYKTNDNHLAAVGVTATDNSGTLQTGLDRIHIGASRSFGSTSFLNGCITQLKYWPTRLPNATLQSLTT